MNDAASAAPSLLPCPFCLRKDTVRVHPPTCDRSTPYNPADRAFPVVRCHGCGASMDGEDWDQSGRTAVEAWNRRAQATPPAVVEPTELSPDFTDTARAALLWVLWHHQGGSSPVGQPIRFALGMGQNERLNEHQLREAKRWEQLHLVNPSVFPRAAKPLARISADAEGGRLG